MVDHPTRVSLLARLRDPEDEAAWWEFERQYRALILGFFRRQGLQEADAEDLRQQVLLQLSRSLPGFRYDRSRGRFRGYLGTTLRRAVAQHFARPIREDHRLDTSVEQPSDASQEAAFEEEWMLHHYRVAMQTLRQSFEAKSMAIFDALLGGQSVAEVAESFALSQQGVHKVKQRVRKRLEVLIAEQVAAEDQEIARDDG